jgi:hypothetical protein
MQGELTGPDVLFLAALLDQPLGQLGAFAISDHPTCDIPAEHIEEYVQIEMQCTALLLYAGSTVTQSWVTKNGQNCGVYAADTPSSRWWYSA